jgi:hypothetical protein
VARRPLTSIALGLCLGGLTASVACDRKWDFECTAIWTDDGKEVWRKVYNYPQMDSETAATARCKEEMLEARPRGANYAECKCVGVE